MQCGNHQAKRKETNLLEGWRNRRHRRYSEASWVVRLNDNAHTALRWVAGRARS